MFWCFIYFVCCLNGKIRKKFACFCLFFVFSFFHSRMDKIMSIVVIHYFVSVKICILVPRYLLIFVWWFDLMMCLLTVPNWNTCRMWWKRCRYSFAYYSIHCVCRSIHFNRFEENPEINLIVNNWVEEENMKWNRRKRVIHWLQKSHKKYLVHRLYGFSCSTQFL